ncbi:MAG: hypothetical protein OMM_14099 [Candidatus Magnetoglobus multicellularis str. Araruama]|uniref:Uncharacterized protein n=1 Tax=Candidatus Magnetoglobus multicellularis str. Araruama TaxID=890399 RepID=A0A1V1NSJ7_9BACT|nr:MAG: hypothetical protein OMM_14099 [Candidatus Magnetoglobus multicellularis str. Araruama]
MKNSERKEGETAREYNQRVKKENEEKELILEAIIEFYAYVVEYIIVRKAELSSISTYLYLDYDKTQLSIEHKQAAINFFNPLFL